MKAVVSSCTPSPTAPDFFLKKDDSKMENGHKEMSGMGRV